MHGTFVIEVELGIREDDGAVALYTDPVAQQPGHSFHVCPFLYRRVGVVKAVVVAADDIDNCTVILYAVSAAVEGIRVF